MMQLPDAFFDSQRWCVGSRLRQCAVAVAVLCRRLNHANPMLPTTLHARAAHVLHQGYQGSCSLKPGTPPATRYF